MSEKKKTRKNMKIKLERKLNYKRLKYICKRLITKLASFISTLITSSYFGLIRLASSLISIQKTVFKFSFMQRYGTDYTECKSRTIKIHYCLSNSYNYLI